jgi:hypothetical protein
LGHDEILRLEAKYESAHWLLLSGDAAGQQAKRATDGVAKKVTTVHGGSAIQ